MNAGPWLQSRYSLKKIEANRRLCSVGLARSVQDILFFLARRTVVKLSPAHFIFTFYWTIITLRCFVSFCCTMKWISCMYAYISSPIDLRPTPVPLGHHRAWAERLKLYSSFSLAICFAHGSVYMSILISQLIPSSPPSCVHVSVLYICVSIPALERGSSVHLTHFRMRWITQ